MNDFYWTDEHHGDLGGEVAQMGVRCNLPIRQRYANAREQAQNVMRATLRHAGCTTVVRFEWEEGFAPVFDEGGVEIGEEPALLGYGFGDRLSTDRPPKLGIDCFYDEVGIFSWEMAHLR